MTPEIRKAGLLLIVDGRILLCRKKHSTSLLILPGGKIEPGETAEQCLRRECREELGDVALSELEHLGVFRDRAAGAAATVCIELFRARMTGTPVAQAEIAELVWFRPDGDRSALAPSIANRILPALERQGLI